MTLVNQEVIESGGDWMVALDRAAVTVVLADGAAVQVREAQPGRR